jgi:hypothetical protein
MRQIYLYKEIDLIVIFYLIPINISDSQKLFFFEGGLV